MPVPTLSGAPCDFYAGDTVIFKESFSPYPATSWNLDFVLSRDGVNLLTTRATSAGNDFLVTVITTGISPGRTFYADILTEISSGQRVTARGGYLSIIPDPTAELAPTPEMTALANIKAKIAALVLNGSKSRSFNGQSSSDRDLKELFDARDRLQAIVNYQLSKLGASQEGGVKTILYNFGNG